MSMYMCIYVHVYIYICVVYRTNNGVGGDRAQCESEKENRETEEVKRCTKEPVQVSRHHADSCNLC